MFVETIERMDLRGIPVTFSPKSPALSEYCNPELHRLNPKKGWKSKSAVGRFANHQLFFTSCPNRPPPPQASELSHP